MTPGMLTDEVSMMEEINGMQHTSYLFVPEENGHWDVRPSNVLTNDHAHLASAKPRHSYHDVVLLEDVDLVYLSTGRRHHHHGPDPAAVVPPTQPPMIMLQPPVSTQPHHTRSCLNSEDDAESGDIIGDELRLQRSTNSFTQYEGGVWSTNLSFVSEVSLRDSEEHGDRVSKISVGGFDDDVVEAKV
ncbi:hypothetical protein DYB35_001907 [Aphanomyces astaci]|uniref:Uncharacterized protein n=1 Tax=Aphanomyces astaci TaxID=112090 RepID=A0A3R7B0X2_APHAT|nr:hypothetical protein DYB35_001907 [Aphanomyces astaci]